MDYLQWDSLDYHNFGPRRKCNLVAGIMCSLGDQSFLQNRQTVDFGESFAPTSKNRIARNHAYFVSAVRGAHLTIFRGAGYQEFNRVNSQNPSHAYENSGKEGAHLTLRASPAYLILASMYGVFTTTWGRRPQVVHFTLRHDSTQFEDLQGQTKIQCCFLFIILFYTKNATQRNETLKCNKKIQEDTIENERRCENTAVNAT